MPSLNDFITKDLFDNPNVPLALDAGRLRARWHRVNIFLRPQNMNANGSLINFCLSDFIADVRRALNNWELKELPEDYDYVADGEAKQIRFERDDEHLYVNPYIFKGCLLPKNDNMVKLKATLDRMENFKYRYHQTVEVIYDISERQLKNLLKRNQDKIREQVIENFATPCDSSAEAKQALLESGDFAFYPEEVMYEHIPNLRVVSLEPQAVMDEIYDFIEKTFDEALAVGDIIAERQNDGTMLYRAATPEKIVV